MEDLRPRQLAIQSAAAETMSSFVPTQQVFDNASKIRDPLSGHMMESIPRTLDFNCSQMPGSMPLNQSIFKQWKQII
jgi:hypothetical protein